ncbi:MFS general substrate transporter [Mycena leptocephala]|nr:MFS general substrate transporter [Mycena leptocephala]
MSSSSIVQGYTTGSATLKGHVELTDQSNRLPFKKLLPIFAGLALCVVVSSLDSVIVATVIPTISSAFNAGSIVSWVPSAYLLTSTCFLPLYGRFSDIFGRKSALCIAMSLFMVGNLLAGFSKTMIQLIVFRGLAGAGGGGLVSMSQIVISDIVSLRESKLLAVDYIGTLLTLGGCTLFILPLIWGGVTFPWKSPMVLAPLLAAFVVVAIFCVWEWKGARLPIVPMYIFKHSTVAGVFIGMFINGFVFFSTLYLLPQFFQVALGYDPLQAGLFLIPFLVTQVFSSWGGGMLVSHTGYYRAIINSGFAVWSIACGCISTIRPHSPRSLQVVSMILAGIGAGLTMQTSTVAVQASVPRRDMAVVTAMRNFIRLLGGTLSLAVASTLLNNHLRTAMMGLNLPSSQIGQIIDNPVLLHTPASLGVSHDIATTILERGYAKGFSSLFILNAALTVLATLVSVVMIKHKELSRDDDEMLRQQALREQFEKKWGMASGTVTLTSGTATPKDLESAVLEMPELTTGGGGTANCSTTCI